ncbi:hypothetical protein Tco_0387808, partial [Tanacetum coccineum]
DDATYVEDQGNEAVEDTNANLEGRDDVMADVVLPQSSSVSSGFVSNMLNPNQDTGVDAIFGHNTKATSLVDIPVTVIALVHSLSSIPGIVDQYLANKLKEAVDVAVQLKSDR